MLFRSESNNVELVNVLIDNGANINAQDKDGNTALHLAISKGYLKIVSSLISHNADPNIKETKRGESSFHVAAKLGNKDILKLLLPNIKNINDPNKFGKTAQQLAHNKKHYSAEIAIRLWRQEGKSHEINKPKNTDTMTFYA